MDELAPNGTWQVRSGRAVTRRVNVHLTLCLVAVKKAV